jgi:site-specific DNA-methyltransferase (adenine-specific)
VTVINMECRAGMATMPENSVDAICTDPPYGLSKEPDMAEVLRHWLAGDDYNHTGGGFMGKKWDSFVPGPTTWREALRVLKPGGYALVFAGARTQDLMSISLRLAGFEIRDCARYYYEDEEPQTPEEAKAAAQTGGGAAWLYGSGFPKSLNVGDGYGTALKPAYEPIIIARKPLIGTVADNVLQFGTGAINIDGCRVGPGDAVSGGGNNFDAKRTGEDRADRPSLHGKSTNGHTLGRWPANVMHDDSDAVVDLFPIGKSGGSPKPGTMRTHGNTYAKPNVVSIPYRPPNEGSAARFFYCAKASKADRNAGLEGFQHHTAGDVTGGRAEGSDGLNSPRSGAGRTSGNKNHHPTVKPTDLMRWCCRLVGHPGALIMDPFAGSGSTGRGAVLEGFSFIGFEMDPDYATIANARVAEAYELKQTGQDND